MSRLRAITNNPGIGSSPVGQSNTNNNNNHNHNHTHSHNHSHNHNHKNNNNHNHKQQQQPATPQTLLVWRITPGIVNG